jgi:putative hydrolase of the HAD superfamily
MSEVVVFDLDDTLYLERDFVRSGFGAVDQWLCTALGAPGFFEEAWGLFEAGARGDIFDRALPALGIAASAELVARLVAVYRAHEPQIALAADARRALGRGRGRPLALLTDGLEAVQERKIAALGLRQWLEPVVCTDRWGRACWKPHPQGFATLEQAFALPGRAFTYVADNPAKDFVGAAARGWRTVRICRPQGLHAGLAAAPGHDAERTITCLDELPL